MTKPTTVQFLTTAIPYVNASPHVGHAFEILIADAIGRHRRQRGGEVLLSGGTDDHSLKNARAAERRGVSTRQLVTEHGARFRELQGALGARLDDYVHTSSDARHAPAVRALWQRCGDRGDLYQREYSGLYCSGCEAFLSATELSAGLCPSHRVAPDPVSERNWFFRLSRYEGVLAEALASGRLRITPDERHAEVLRFVRGGLRDFSVSRDAARSRDWGLPVPGDPTQVVYVWFDALANYLSVLGFPEQTSRVTRFWHESGSREHLIGKDILRFHAVYWPAILSSAGLPLPSGILVHGFLTQRGEKISKSLGNAVDPFGLVERYGLDAVRYYFLRHLHTTKDSDFRAERLIEAHDAELAGKLGNLLQRVCAIALRHPSLVLVRGPAADSDADRELRDAAERALRDVSEACDAFALHDALAAVLTLVGAANRYADAEQPWLLSRRATTAKTSQATADLLAQLAHVLWRLLEALRVCAILLAPFLPDGSQRLARRLGLDASELTSLASARFGRSQPYRLSAGPPAFPRLGGHLAAPGPLLESS